MHQWYSFFYLQLNHVFPCCLWFFHYCWWNVVFNFWWYHHFDVEVICRLSIISIFFVNTSSIVWIRVLLWDSIYEVVSAMNGSVNFVVAFLIDIVMETILPLIFVALELALLIKFSSLFLELNDSLMFFHLIFVLL